MVPPLSLLLLLLSTHSAYGFVFSCQEVKDRLINSDLTEPTEYVCLVRENGYSNLEGLKKIYAQNDKISVSLYEIATAADLCIPRVTGSGGWKIVADLPVSLDCFQQFSLIFTSFLPNFVLAQNGGFHRIQADTVVVSPRGGMQIHSYLISCPFCPKEGNVTIFTGAGTGVNEYRYPLESWRWREVPDWIVSFENVITIHLDPGVPYAFDVTSDFQSETTLTPHQSVSILTSGKSDNLQNAHPLENYAKFGIGELVTATAKGELTFDSHYDGSIEIRFTNNDGQSIQRFSQNGTVNFAFNASSFEVHYLTSIPEIVWDSQDNFYIDITLTALPTKPAPAIPGEVNANGYCGCGMDYVVNFDTDGTWKLTDIWLDLIFILDISEGMASGINEASGLIEQIVELLQTDPSKEFYTRVGVITMADVPTIIYDLNMGSDDELDVAVATGVYKFDMTAAFKAALDMFKNGKKANRDDRTHARQAIYYITNADPDDIDDGIKMFKTSGEKIIVNDFSDAAQGDRPGLQELASPGFYSNQLKNYLNTYPLLCNVNCFCHKREAYAGANPDEKVEAAGGCFRVQDAEYAWTKAQKECEKTQNGKISAPHNKDKEFYLNSLISGSFGPNQPFWLGYSSDGTKWTFEDNSTDPWTDFDPNENINNGVQYAYQVQTTGFNSI